MGEVANSPSIAPLRFPFALGAGIWLYFNFFYLQKSPDYLLLLPLFCLPVLKYDFAKVLFCCSLGIASAKIKVDLTRTEQIDKVHFNQKISGNVKSIEYNGANPRVTFTDVLWNDNRLKDMVRLRIKNLPDNLHANSRLEMNAHILPLSKPLLPGGFDFQFHGFFQNIAATGSASVNKVLSNIEQPWDFRTAFSNKIRSYLPPIVGDIATALVTGDKSGIKRDLQQQFADAGIAHILAISGLHLGLVAGIFFFFFRRSMALSPYLSEHFNTKKIAAFLIIPVTFGYLWLAGFAYPAIRSWIMTSFFMLGIIFDRQSISLNSISLSACIILFLWPESIFSPSFQLSFAAVIALILAYERLHLPKYMKYVSGIALSTLITTLATAPFIIYTFGRVTVQGLLGNFIAIPLTGFVIMPLGVLAILSLLIYPLPWLMKIWGLSIKLLILTAKWVSSLPGASIIVAKPHPVYILLVLLGILIFSRRFKLVGYCSIALTPFCFFVKKPDIIVHPQLIGLRNGDTLWVSKNNPWISSIWQSGLGISKIKVLQENKIIPFGKEAITLIVKGQKCPSNLTNIMISTNYLKGCREDIMVLDKYFLQEHGQFVVYLADKKITSF